MRSTNLKACKNASVCLVTQLCLTLCNPKDCSPPGSSVHGDSPGKNTGVGCHALLQGIFPNQGLSPSLLHCRWILYSLSHQGSPLLEYIVVTNSGNHRGRRKPYHRCFFLIIRLRVLSAHLVGGELVLEGFPSSLLLWVQTQSLSTQLPQC